MGASTWVSFTPYQPKPSAALRQLREEVFARGQYRKPLTVQERLKQLGPLPLPSQLHLQTLERLRRSYEQAPSPEIEQAIARAEQLAEEAAKREPEYLRLMEAFQTGTIESLPEVLEWNRSAQQAYGPTPAIPMSRRSKKQSSVTAGIAMLLLQAAQQGTHSVLDIVRVGKKAAHATAIPLPESLLRKTFGTIQPTRAQVEKADLTFAQDLNWQAVYFAIYRDGTPQEWVFVGSSGD